MKSSLCSPLAIGVTVLTFLCGILYITRLAFHSKDLFTSFIKIEKMKKRLHCNYCFNQMSDRYLKLKKNNRCSVYYYSYLTLQGKRKKLVTSLFFPHKREPHKLHADK